MSQAVAKSDRKISPLSNPANRAPASKRVELPSQAEHAAQSLDKHGQNLRYRAAYIANCLADDITDLFRRRGKKDKEYLKGLVWSFGVMFDKAVGGQSNEAVVMRIPAKLLDNVKAVIAIQVSKKAKVAQPVPNLVSGTQPIDSTGCIDVVAQAVAALVDSPSSSSSPTDPVAIPSDPQPIDRGATLAPSEGGRSGSGTATSC